MPILDSFLGLSLVEKTINNMDCFIPNLKDIRHPINDYKSFKFIFLNNYSKINIKIKKNNFCFDIGFIELQPGKKRWYISCKEDSFTKHFYYESRLYLWKEIDINDLNKFKVEYKDYKITNKEFDSKFNSLLNDLIRVYAKPFTTVGLLLSICFIESIVELLKKYNLDNTSGILYYLHEEVFVLEKWRSWLDLIPKPTETESVFFNQ
jgi:hypothetical protein